jgi:hypothetical protein
MYYTGIEEEGTTEEGDQGVWNELDQKLWNIHDARAKGEAEFPVLEFDDPPEGQTKPRMLYTRTMLCLPKIRAGEEIAMTTSAIIELPTNKADGYVHFFGEE